MTVLATTGSMITYLFDVTCVTCTTHEEPWLFMHPAQPAITAQVFTNPSVASTVRNHFFDNTGHVFTQTPTEHTT